MYGKWRHCHYISLFTVYDFGKPPPPPWYSTYYVDAPQPGRSVFLLFTVFTSEIEIQWGRGVTANYCSIPSRSFWGTHCILHQKESMGFYRKHIMGLYHLWRKKRRKDENDLSRRSCSSTLILTCTHSSRKLSFDMYSLLLSWSAINLGKKRVEFLCKIKLFWAAAAAAEHTNFKRFSCM